MFTRLLLAALMNGCVYGMIGLGFSLIYRASGLMTMTQGELLMLGAFFGLTFYSYLGLPFVVAIVLTVAVMFLVGMAVERFAIRRVLKKHAPPIFVVLTTIAVSIIFQNSAMLTWGSKLFYFPSSFGENMIELKDGVRISPEYIVVLISSAAIMLGLHFFTTKSNFGTAMRSAAQDSLAASACGVNVPLTTGVTWGIAAVVAASTGIIIGPINGITYHMGSLIGMKGFAAAIVGGYGNMYGAICGGLLIGFVETFTAGYISSSYKDFIAFIVLFAFIAVKPTGLFNEKVIE